MAEYQQVARLDPASITERVRALGGPSLEIIGPLQGGAVGAWRVRWPDGHESVLTQNRGTPVDDHGFATAVQLMNTARAVGVPCPAYEATFDLHNGTFAIVQECVCGIPIEATTEAHVEQMLEFAGLRVGTVPAGIHAAPLLLYLSTDGPGYCLHDPLRAHNPATRSLVERIEAVGETTDSAIGNDIVHLDYHLGNALVDEHRTDEIVAIVDWGGTRPGHIGMDLMILAFDLGWRSPPLSRIVEGRLRSTIPATLFTALWAHASLRLVDWSIRHHPQDVDYWVDFASRHL